MYTKHASICQMFNKEKFPYAETAYYAAVLWRNQSHQEVHSFPCLPRGTSHSYVYQEVHSFPCLPRGTSHSYVYQEVHPFPSAIIFTKIPPHVCLINKRSAKMYEYLTDLLIRKDLHVSSDAENQCQDYTCDCHTKMPNITCQKKASGSFTTKDNVGTFKTR